MDKGDKMFQGVQLMIPTIIEIAALSPRTTDRRGVCVDTSEVNDTRTRLLKPEISFTHVTRIVVVWLKVLFPRLAYLSAMDMSNSRS